MEAGDREQGRELGRWSGVGVGGSKGIGWGV